ncbi:MAG: hypothetical protein WA919_08240 [Coleofasciculaceae cyanobacterium]
MENASPKSQNFKLLIDEPTVLNQFKTGEIVAESFEINTESNSVILDIPPPKDSNFFINNTPGMANPSNTIIPEPASNPIIMLEAEDMILDCYLVETSNSASGGQLISLFQSELPEGTASEELNVASGIYDIVVGYYDESDGAAQLEVLFEGNSLDSWTLNKKLGSASPSSQNFTERTISGQTLTQGGNLAIKGTVNKSEYARVDYIKLIPVEIFAATSPLGAASTDSLLGSGTLNPFAFTPESGADLITAGADALTNFLTPGSGVIPDLSLPTAGLFPPSTGGNPLSFLNPGSNPLGALGGSLPSLPSV